jgi:probable HAF family extracellular repeat protein
MEDGGAALRTRASGSRTNCERKQPWRRARRMAAAFVAIAFLLAAAPSAGSGLTLITPSGTSPGEAKALVDLHNEAFGDFAEGHFSVVVRPHTLSSETYWEVDFTPYLGADPVIATPAPLGDAGNSAIAFGITLAGGDIVAVGGSESGNRGPYHAFRWSLSTGTTVDLGTLDPPNNATRQSFARAVSRDGAVVVGFSQTANGNTHAFRWTQATGMVDLDAANPDSTSRAFGVNGDGSVVVGERDGRAFRWTQTGGFEDLGRSIATAVSADGSVVVGRGANTAFRWTQATGMQTIGALDGHTASSATGVSDNGNVVFGLSTALPLDNAGVGGDFRYDRASTRAFRWTAGTGIKDFTQLLADRGVDVTGITLLTVKGVSADGQSVGGAAATPTTAQNQTTAFIARYCDGAIGGPCIVRTLRADFNGDNRSEILWRNAATGDNAIWQMNGHTPTASALIPAVPDASWRMVASGDFDASGKADILWRNIVTGDNAIWLMNGFTLSASALVAQVPDLAWTIAAVGDFNGDGKSDILWRNGASGDNAVWLMDGFNIVTAALIARVADPNWTIEKAGDFSGDGKADILWRNGATGEIAIWLMDGTTLTAGAVIGIVPAAWVIVGAADYDGSGKADILWRNTTTGDNAIWLMNGLTIANTGLIPAVPNAAWTIVASGDYNGDAKADILWRNTTTGENAIWLMDGLTLSASGLIPTVADQVWTIVNQ